MTELVKDRLSPNIELSQELQRMTKAISEKAVSDANLVVKHLRPMKPGFVINIPEPDLLHQALRLHTSPVGQGANAGESETRFRQWLESEAVNLYPECREFKVGTSGWVGIPFEIMNKLVYGKWHVIPWINEIRSQSLFADRPPAQVLALVSKEEQDKAYMFLASSVFG